jgi:hypothetical protein
MAKPIDFEALALGLKPEESKDAVIKNDHLVITADESAIASRLPNSSEYNFILRVLEGEIIKLETEHMQNWRDKELFERTGLVAVASRMLYERFQSEINYHSSEYLGAQEAYEVEQEVAELSPEDFIRRGFGMDLE